MYEAIMEELDFDPEYTDTEIRTIFYLADRLYTKHCLTKGCVPICDLIESLYPQTDLKTKNEILNAYTYVMINKINTHH